MTESEIAWTVDAICAEIQQDLGPGLYEPIYEAELIHELSGLGLQVRRRPGCYPHRIGFVVEEKVLVAVTSLAMLPELAERHVRACLRLSGIRLGMIVDFGMEGKRIELPKTRRRSGTSS